MNTNSLAGLYVIIFLFDTFSNPDISHKLSIYVSMCIVYSLYMWYFHVDHSFKMKLKLLII